jgi:hypothetical protein
LGHDPIVERAEGGVNAVGLTEHEGHDRCEFTNSVLANDPLIAWAGLKYGISLSPDIRTRDDMIRRENFDLI